MPLGMACNRGIESLSAELLDTIISDLSMRDRRMLSQASRHLHESVAPGNYDSWSYHGHSDSFKSLYCFLRTMILHPELASHVKTLDIREWGRCPRLEDSYRPPGSPNGYSEWLDGEYGDEDEDEDESDESSENRSDWALDPAYEEDLGILQRAVHALELDRDNAAEQVTRLSYRDENVLLALIISRLPNLATLYMVKPEGWGPICNVILQASKLGSQVCKNLHTIYVCEALTLGVKGHREYFLELDDVLSLLQIPALRSLQTLTASTYGYHYKDYENHDQDIAKTSEVTELAFEESLIEPHDLFRAIRLPKALRSFRWGQLDDDSVAYKLPPADLQRALVEALKVQKESLEILDLNGIAPKRKYDLSTNKDEHLVQSLREFKALKKLAIPALALCGDRTWGLAPHKIIDTLPTSLQTLDLRIKVQLEGPERRINEIWMVQMIELVQNADAKLPKLRKVTLVWTNDWRPAPKDGRPFERLEEACGHAKIAFEARKETMFGVSQVPYFQEVRAGRMWGCDF